METHTNITPPSNNSSGANTVLLVLIIILLVGGGYWWYMHNKANRADNTPAINIDVKLPTTTPDNTQNQ